MPHVYNESTNCYDLCEHGEYINFKDGDFLQVNIDWDNDAMFKHNSSWFEYVNLYINDGASGKMIKVNDQPIHTYTGWKQIAKCTRNVLAAVESANNNSYMYFVEVVQKSLT